MTDLTALKAANAKRWANAKLTRNFSSVARALVAAKQRYVTVQAKAGVPWYFIAVVHEREASQNWDTHLGQGDPLHAPTRHIPSEPAFNTWEEGAYDALVNCGPYAARNKDWSIGGLLTMLEEYNGLGYFSRGLPSPYIWSGTDQYKSGKYVRDGVFDRNAIDVQLGCAGLLMAMMALDPTITFTGATITPVVPKTGTAPAPSITNPAKGSLGAAIASLVSAILSIFKPKGK